MSAINININGQDISVEPGTTILQAARILGIDIPTLCHDPELAPNGACRICVVEVENARALVASCVAPVAPGMKILTESGRVVNARKGILNLLVANHPLVCITCEKTGDCRLQDYCYRYGVADSEFSGERKELPLDDTNAFFVRDMNKCILCGICVGKCQEVVGAGAIDFTRRGFVSNVGPAFEDSIEESSCVFCGMCIDSCPVGALIPKSATGKGRPWEVEQVKAVCPYCSIGCNINLHVKDNKVIGVSAVKEETVNRGHLCVRGKFGWDYLQSGDRLTTPLIKSNGVFVKVSWEEALGYIVDNLEEAMKRYGAHALMGLCSPKVSNEESFLFQKLFHSLGTNNIDSYTRHCHAPSVDGLMKAFGSAAMTNSIEELSKTGTVLVIEADPDDTHPVLSYRVREAARKGAKLVVANTHDTDLGDVATCNLLYKSGTAVALVNAIANVIVAENLHDLEFIEKRTEGFNKFCDELAGYTPQKVSKVTGIEEELIYEAARTYALAEKAAIISTVGVEKESDNTNLVLALANLALLTGNLGRESTGLYLPYGENNLQGIADMGVLSNLFSGYQHLDDKDARDKFMRSWNIKLSDQPGQTAARVFETGRRSGIKAMYILDENPVSCAGDHSGIKAFLKGLDFLIVQDIFMTETASLADVILPAAGFAEHTGTYTSTERRVQLSHAAVKPPGEAHPGWAIIAELAGWLGLKWEYEGPEDVFEEIAHLTPQYTGISYNRLAEGSLQWPCKSEDHPGTPYLYEGRFSRGLGLFTPVHYAPEDDITKTGNQSLCFVDSHSCRCGSESMSKRSVIDNFISSCRR